MDYPAILNLLQKDVPTLSGLWLFGSHAIGQTHADSDLDLALLADEPLDVVALWELSETLADIAQCPVDLLDLRAASTVMQYQIIMQGRRLWMRDVSAALYECFILSEKLALDEARAGRLADIQATGKVYGG